jgi:hypothetical protein
MELWTKTFIEDLWNEIGKILKVDLAFKSSGNITIARVLVEIDTSYGMIESFHIVVGERMHSQVLDYFNLPLWCIWCHLYGDIIADNSKPFVIRVWRKNDVDCRIQDEY